MTVHTYPLDDIHEHVTNGDPCPCLARPDWRGPEVIVHNSYDGRELGEACLRALDLLGSALAGHAHTWTPEERWRYEQAVDLLNAHDQRRTA